MSGASVSDVSGSTGDVSMTAVDDGALNVRRANLADDVEAQAIASVIDAHARTETSLGIEFGEEGRRAIAPSLRACDDVTVLVAEREGRIVGAVVCVEGFTTDSLGLHDVAVATEGVGDRPAVAGALMAAAEELARKGAGPPRSEDVSWMATATLRDARDTKAPLPLRVGVDVLQDWEIFVGGAVSPETYLAGVRRGVFLLSGEGGDRRWCGPSHRAVFPLTTPLPSSVRRAMKRPQFRVTVDTAFADVVRACSERSGKTTWIAEDVLGVEVELHRRGLAHSVEIWNATTNALVGGIFGIAVGGAFFGESMFHRETDASKAAFGALVERLRASDFGLFDVQLMTPHLASLGCVEIARAAYREALAIATAGCRRVAHFGVHGRASSSS